MTSPNPSKKRMDTDVIKLMTSKHKVKLLSNLNEFIVVFHGPKDTPYEGGYWNIRVELPEKYPYKSPSIGFMNRIFHPNIDEPSGSVCLDVINQTWTPLYDLRNIFDQFLPQLLIYPNPSDPLNGEAATMYMHNKEAYIKRVKETVQKYATKEVLKKQSNFQVDDDEDSSDSEESDSEINETANSLASPKKCKFSEPKVPPLIRNRINPSPQSSISSQQSSSNPSSKNSSPQTVPNLFKKPQHHNASNPNFIPIIQANPINPLRVSPNQNSNDSGQCPSSFQSGSSRGLGNIAENVIENQFGDMERDEGATQDNDSEDENMEMSENDNDCSDLSDNEIEMDF